MSENLLASFFIIHAISQNVILKRRFYSTIFTHIYFLIIQRRLPHGTHCK
nr:MAG TPA: hypothetical protein [Caudoviricetes sp.]